MSLLFISDLHISGPEDPYYNALLKVLQERPQSGDTVVLAGDVFDLFVGNKSVFKDRYSEFFEILRASIQKGVEFHYIEGNHDFLIEKAFESIPQLKLHATHTELNAGDKKFFVAHGDLVDRSDFGYLLLRRFFRSFVMKAFVTVIPGEWLDEFGKFSSKQSRKRKPILPSEMPIQRMERLRRVYRSFAAEQLAKGFDFVVLGHCHDLDEMIFNIGGRCGQYVNIGFPRNHGSFLSWTEGDEKIQREKLSVPDSAS
ncbi:MAG: UDP-2,3-diacylglucosamine diphosphatase [Bdellovibrio sp.]|nr:UDP-2,3-diacylglucosamine diphosphatase [Bdellovibrio sp.]